MSACPPKPPVSLAVGVVGHRPNRLPEQARDKVKEEIARVLGALREQADKLKSTYAPYFAATRPQLLMVSGLAEGADQMAAESALALGYELDAPLPFEPNVYEADFEGDASIAAFRSLCSHARAVLVLPGQRANSGQAYENLGQTVLSQSDILLAIWDGGPAAGRSGTTDLLSQAANLGLPIIHVDANGKEPTMLLWNDAGTVASSNDLLATLSKRSLWPILPALIDDLVKPPEDPGERTALRTYLAQGAARVNWRLEFPLLLAALRVRPIRTGDVLPAGPAKLAEDYARLQAEPTGLTGEDLPALAVAYGWADRIAGSLGQAFRGAFISNFLLAAFSVVAAVGSLVAHDPSELEGLAHHKLPFVVTEVVLIALVLANTIIGRRRAWHSRWLEAREIAERLRAALPLWLLGLRPLGTAGQENVWTGWYVRALLRSQGLRAGSLTGAGLQSARAAIIEILRDQSGYNHANAKRMHHLDHRLEKVGEVFFVATLLTAITFIIAVLVGIEIAPRIAFIVTALAAALPALATATYGIRQIGDFEGISERAERTHRLLEKVLEQAAADDPDELPTLKARAQAGADALLSDVASWRLAAESRGLSVPG